MITTERAMIGYNKPYYEYKSITSQEYKNPADCYKEIQIFANLNQNRGFTSVSEIWHEHQEIEEPNKNIHENNITYSLTVIYYIGYFDDSPNM